MATDDWRNHSGLLGRFHPDSPDDLRVFVHDGYPMITGRGAELMWVRVKSRKADVPSRSLIVSGREVGRGGTRPFRISSQPAQHLGLLQVQWLRMGRGVLSMGLAGFPSQNGMVCANIVANVEIFWLQITRPRFSLHLAYLFGS